MGWNSLTDLHPHPLLAGIKPQVDFYFVHSYHCIPDDPDHVLARCDYGGDFVAVVGHANVVGMQFHPEKSADQGLALYRNFLHWNP